MDEITNKIKSAINVFLNSDDFVVKPLIETETEIGFIIVSDLEKINQLTTMKNKINHRVFIELLTKAMNGLFAIPKRIYFETEVLYARK
jgi:hypothetical protein